MASGRINIVSEAQWDRLLARIYDAAIDTSLWPDVLLDLGRPIRAHAAQLATVGRTATDTFEDVVAGLPSADAVPEFEELVSRGEQIRVNHATTIDVFQPMYDYQHTSEREMRRSLFYQEHVYPLTVDYYAGTVLKKDERSLTAIVHFRRKAAGHFSPNEIAYLMRLAPHVYRSMELSLQSSQQTTIRTAESLLSSLRCAAVIIDQQYRIVAANDWARRLVAEADGISELAGRLGIASDRAGKSLYRQLATFLGGCPQGAIVSAPCILAPRPSGKIPYRLSVCPLQRELEPFLRRFAVVLILDPERSDPISEKHLREEVGLTPAEAGIASLLAQGRTVREIAALRGCRVETVRSQLKQILGKTGCSRQAELVSLLLRSTSIPASASDGL